MDVSAARLEAILRAAPAGIGVEVDRLITDVNDRLCAITGYAAPELLGRPLRQLFASGADYDHITRQRYDPRRAAVVLSHETQFRRKDGRIVDVMLSSAPIVPGDCRPGVVFTVIDISHHKATARSLDRERQLRADAARVAHIGGWEWDVQADRLVVSREWREIHGVARAILTSADLLDLVHPGDAAAVRAGLDRLARGEPYELEHRIRRPSDGSIRVIRVYAETTRDAAGRPARAHGAVQDITELRAAEEAARRLAEELEQRVRERTQALADAIAELEAFNHSVSHDLRAPLRHIEGFARALAEDHAGVLPPDARRCVDRILHGVERMTALIDALLRLSRAGRAELQRAPLDLAALVREVFESLPESHVPGRPIDLVVGPLPVVEADPALTRQLFENLLGNALKFTRPRERAEIRVEVADPGPPPVFAVRDNGVGFDPGATPRLFGVFQRFHSAGEFEGTGIGLSIVQRIVRRHGGRIWAEASPGHGATFYFTLAPGQGGPGEPPA